MYTSFFLGVLGGLLSGVLVYLVRQKIRANRLRKAIATEIRKSTPLGPVKTSLMGEDALKTPIIESNLNKVHLLKKREISLIANYHRHMGQVRAVNERKSGKERVNIPAKMQKRGVNIANSTADTLESNIWNIPNPLSQNEPEIPSQEQEPRITEEEAEEKREELMKRAKEYKEKNRN